MKDKLLCENCTSEQPCDNCANNTPDRAKKNCCAPDPKESFRLSSPFYQTVEGMLSPDYKERFKAEYQQTKIRYDKLHAMLVKADAGKLEFEPTCPLDLLRHQAQAMGQYLYCLEVRAQMEGVELK